jgi:hypothetical protein
MRKGVQTAVSSELRSPKTFFSLLILLTFNNSILQVLESPLLLLTFQDPTCYESMKNTMELRKGSDAYIGDIYTGSIYTEHVKSNRLGALNQLSYSLCTDGVK